ncbi:PREDICTED: C2 calcium-dependent domain-containing protein 4A [Dipodomys ordii]|uniref:C2 calcium-dependent domain-containing protein 4A n=1 Tax=Dipodomys ordii TaxID=10020 RepID=A0A1S3EPI6_DIPOR|nr:PREDICTED: C2 calcium-dependent domain-containing protein 4A [Dipodomys ordii]
MWCLERLLRDRDGLLLGRTRHAQTRSPSACANVLTPERIPEFCIPPRLESSLTLIDLRNAWEQMARTDEGAGRTGTDWDPRSQAALSLPHLPRAQIRYSKDFCHRNIYQDVMGFEIPMHMQVLKCASFLKTEISEPFLFQAVEKDSNFSEKGPLKYLLLSGSTKGMGGCDRIRLSLERLSRAAPPCCPVLPAPAHAGPPGPLGLGWAASGGAEPAASLWLLCGAGQPGSAPPPAATSSPSVAVGPARAPGHRKPQPGPVPLSQARESPGGRWKALAPPASAPHSHGVRPQGEAGLQDGHPPSHTPALRMAEPGTGLEPCVLGVAVALGGCVSGGKQRGPQDGWGAGTARPCYLLSTSVAACGEPSGNLHIRSREGGTEPGLKGVAAAQQCECRHSILLRFPASGPDLRKAAAHVLIFTGNVQFPFWTGIVGRYTGTSQGTLSEGLSLPSVVEPNPWNIGEIEAVKWPLYCQNPSLVKCQGLADVTSGYKPVSVNWSHIVKEAEGSIVFMVDGPSLWTVLAFSLKANEVPDILLKAVGKPVLEAASWHPAEAHKWCQLSTGSTSDICPAIKGDFFLTFSVTLHPDPSVKQQAALAYISVCVHHMAAAPQCVARVFYSDCHSLNHHNDVSEREKESNCGSKGEGRQGSLGDSAQLSFSSPAQHCVQSSSTHTSPTGCLGGLCDAQQEVAWQRPPWAD